jgi:MFS family permease
VSDTKHPTRQVLVLPAVRYFVASRFFYGLARGLLHATLAWHVWKLSGSALYLGLLGLLEFLPVIPVSLFAGAVADSRDRKAIVVSAQSLILAGCALLYLSTDGNEASLWVVLGLPAALAAAMSFESPAGTSILPGLVPAKLFPQATVIQANVRNLAAVSGPVLMGFVTRYADISAAYGLATLFLCASVLLTTRIEIKKATTQRAPLSWTSVKQGIAFVLNSPVIFGSMVLDMFAVIFAGATALLPIYADEILGVGEIGYGILSASMQIGTIAMALILLALQPIERAGRALIIAVLFFGLATILFGISRSFWLSVAAFALAGMADQVSMTSRSIILQLSTPDSLRGRVNSVNMIFIGASNELGAAESGFLAAVTSATFSVVFGGLACLGILGGVSMWVPEMWRYRVSSSHEANGELDS